MHRNSKLWNAPNAKTLNKINPERKRLHDNLHRLPAKDREFAMGLLRTTCPTVKQNQWIHRLSIQATQHLADPLLECLPLPKTG
jgi:hypothetical protein